VVSPTLAHLALAYQALLPFSRWCFPFSWWVFLFLFCFLQFLCFFKSLHIFKASSLVSLAFPRFLHVKGNVSSFGLIIHLKSSHAFFLKISKKLSIVVGCASTNLMYSTSVRSVCLSDLIQHLKHTCNFSLSSTLTYSFLHLLNL